jgi:polysaccharide export outer membrane protein
MRVIVAFVAAACLAGCSSLPTSGPSSEDVQAQAVGVDQVRYELVDINNRVLDVLSRRGADSLRSSFGDYRPSLEPHIGVGDFISVTVWEAAPGGLFSGPAVLGPVSTGSKSATMPDQVVGRDGSISVPYAGRINVAGRTPQDVQKVVERALDGKAIQPQALVTVTRPLSNTVTVTGEVVQGARIPLSVKGDRLLDVISSAGGIRVPSYDTYIQLSRGNKTARVPFTRVLNDPRENIFLRPDDVVALVREPQTFMAMGATPRNAEVPFDAAGITLSQAMARTGGLIDIAADPSGVFIFRYEPDSIARLINPSSPLLGSGAVPTVYRLDMRDANSLFLAQRFRIFARDVLYISTSPSVQTRKVIDMVNAATAPLANAGTVASAAATAYSVTRK